MRVADGLVRPNGNLGALTSRALRRFFPVPFRAQPERPRTVLIGFDEVRVPSEHQLFRRLVVAAQCWR